MRILVDARHLTLPAPTGVGEYTRQLFLKLLEIDKENEYVMLTTGLKTAVARARHFFVPNKLLNTAIATLGWPSLNSLGGSGFDLVFCPNLNFIAITPGVPYILTIHDLSWRIFSKMYSRKDRLWHHLVRPHVLVQDAAAVVVPSESTKLDVVNLMGKAPEAVHVIPHGLDPMYHHKILPSDFGIRSRYRLPQRFALFVGTVEPRKNLAAIQQGLEAYRRQTHDDLSLVIVGQGSSIGYVPAADLPAIYRAATVFIWPSWYEGFGLPVLEAMACGTPVITSHVSSLPEVAGEAAIYVEPAQPGNITAALQELMASSALRERLREAGIKRAALFSWEKAAGDTLAVINHCAKI